MLNRRAGSKLVAWVAGWSRRLVSVPFQSTNPPSARTTTAVAATFAPERLFCRTIGAANGSAAPVIGTERVMGWMVGERIADGAPEPLPVTADRFVVEVCVGMRRS